MIPAEFASTDLASKSIFLHCRVRQLSRPTLSCSQMAPASFVHLSSLRHLHQRMFSQASKVGIPGAPNLLLLYTELVSVRPEMFQGVHTNNSTFQNAIGTTQWARSLDHFTIVCATQ